ncbi:MAG: response regulator transcription factor [Pseudomonadales bacterium]|nr:response regulator transcription factor [Pseudomonadales bacterium]MCP5184967.1 response regulator transcription factor [Pseudomonadales bacterium]
MTGVTGVSNSIETTHRHGRHGLVLEDLAASASWLAAVLGRAFPGMEVAIAGSLAQARHLILEQPPEIALVDLELPDGSGVELIRELTASWPDCRCIVTTIYADDRHLFPALRAGAAGYLLKDLPEERVIGALRAIHAGEPPLSPAIARRLLQIFGNAPASPDAAHLTARERDTLVLLAKGLRLPEVAAQLNVTRNTAAGYIKVIYRKLKVSSRAEATMEAVRLGLVRHDL